LFALDHNFMTWNPSRSSKISKDLEFSLVSKKLQRKLPPGGLGKMKWA